jgi:hypothetical protein
MECCECDLRFQIVILFIVFHNTCQLAESAAQLREKGGEEILDEFSRHPRCRRSAELAEHDEELRRLCRRRQVRQTQAGEVPPQGRIGLADWRSPGMKIGTGISL